LAKMLCKAAEGPQARSSEVFIKAFGCFDRVGPRRWALSDGLPVIETGAVAVASQVDGKGKPEFPRFT